MPRAKTIEEKKAAVTQVRTTTERSTSTRVRNKFNGTEGKLTVGHQIPGYVLHGFNDSPGRIEQALEGGWEFVHPDEVGGTKVNVVSRNTDLGDKVRWLVGRTEDGQDGQYAYVMKIKQEWYDEDQSTMQAKVNLIDDAIQHGRGHQADTEGFYVPKGGIKMGQSNKH